MKKIFNFSAYTLTELLVTIAIIAIVSLIAVPSYRTYIRNNQIHAASQNFLDSLQFARDQALARRTTVSICPISNANSLTCDISPTPQVNWKYGWIVFVGDSVTNLSSPSNILQIEKKNLSTDVFFTQQNLNLIKFNYLGFASGFTNNTVCIHFAPEINCTNNTGRKITIKSNLVELQKTDCANMTTSGCT